MAEFSLFYELRCGLHILVAECYCVVPPERVSAVALLRVTRKRSCTFGMINRGRLELATSPIEYC